MTKQAVVEINEALIEPHIHALGQIAGALDMEEVFKRIVEVAVSLSGADEASLLLRDEESGILYLRAAKEFDQVHAVTRRQPVEGDSMAEQVMKTGHPVLKSKEPDSAEQIKVRPGYLVNSVLNLPLKQGDVIRGILGVYNSRSALTFEQRHLLLLTPLANYAVIAIKNARRHRGTEQLLHDTYALSQIAELFNETHDLDELLYLIASQTLARLRPVDRAVIHLFDPHTNRLEHKVRIPPSMEDEAEEGRGFAIGQGIAGRVLQENQPINIPDVKNEPSFDETRDITFGSLLVAPISKRGLCIGTISAASPGKNAFRLRDEGFLANLANLAAIAIESAEFLEAERARATQLRVVAELAEKLTSILDPDELLRQTVSLIHETFGFEDVSIRLVDPEVDGLVFKVTAGLRGAGFGSKRVQKLGQGMAGWAAQTGQTALSNDVSQDPHYISLGLSDTKSELDVPLKYHDEVIGVLGVQSQSLNAFGRHDVLAMEALAAQIAVAIENARLYDRQSQLFKENQQRLEKVEQRNKELSSLRDILGALQSTLSLSEVLSRVVNGIVEGLDYRAVVLSTVDEASQLLKVQKVDVESDPALLDLLEPKKRLADQERQALIGNSISLIDHKNNIGVQVYLDGQARVTHRLYDISKPIVGQEMCGLLQDMFSLTSFAVLPIRTENRPFGVLYAATRRKKISPISLEGLQAFADQASLAIQNARQFERMHGRLRRRVGELQGLQDIDRLISSTLDLEMMLKNILDMGLKLVDAECGNIVLADQETGALVPKVSYPQGSISIEKYEPGLAVWVARARETARVPDLSVTPWAATYRDLNIRSELASPILVGEELVGVINIDSSKPDAFTEEDESLLNILATQAAVAIQTARYYQELAKSRLRQSEAERIAAMSDMASNVVHSINNSTGAIRVLVQQLQRNIAKDSLTPELLSKKLADIESSARKTLEMARSIRNPFKYQPTELIEVNACLKDALQSFEPIPSTMSLTLKLDEVLPPVMATQQLEEVFRNLIKNAIEAMEGVGILHISSRQIGQAVVVAVTDSGTGIPDDMTESGVFNLGVSSKRDGLGYGLWWCKIYLNRVGGSVELDRSFKFGCRFVVTLSLDSAAHATETGTVENN